LLKLLALLVSLNCQAGQKDVAINNAKEAFLIQSRTYEYANKAGKYMLTQLNAEKPVVTSLFVYKTIRNKTISFPYKDKKITLTPNQVQISFPF
jgi:hypothetical protein